MVYQSLPGNALGDGMQYLWRDRPPGKNAELKSIIITIRKTNNDDNKDNNPFKVVCPQSLLHRKQTSNIQIQDTNNQNTNREKTHQPGNKNKQVMLMQSTIKYSARLDKKECIT